MAWIGMGTLDRAEFDLRGLSTQGFPPGPPPALCPDAILPVGSLVFEAQVAARSGGVQRLIRLHRDRGWTRQFLVTLGDDGRVCVSLRQGNSRREASLTLPVPAREARLRVTYAWNGPERHAVVSVENLDQETLHQVEMHAPFPLLMDDLAQLIRGGRGVQLDTGVRWIALSDRVEPVGLPLGVAEGTPIDTPEGPCPIDQLRPGDLVTTPEGPRAIRWITRREVPALGAYRPIQLRAPYHGLTSDILVAPDHRLLVSGGETEYLFAEDAVLVEACHLVDGRTTHRAFGGGLMRYHHILLDEHACLSFAGLQGESLFVGAMGRDEALIATTALAAMPARAIPRHRAFARLPLSSYEARILAASLVA
ncbi:Hint domain-containing protein [Aliiroseovarius sp.]|uniref:Hint domain-containing protein n=1 Tax=Aliiroseovarius sp. TaxID=1872442 RepID=UPI002612A828|nr:Hint domain-containing protein [Aliiroseovarius sp.]